MSLNVSEVLVQQAIAGAVEEQIFAETIRQSLPYAWGIVETLAQRLEAGEEWADHAVPPPDEQARGQLLRMVGGDAIRGAVERHFDLKLAFQNCHRLAVFDRDAWDSAAYRNFISVRSQVLNQTPDLKDC
ncbi:MAG: SCO5389 family protein [Cyanobacteria bacterium]|nr:SCO5389 family protein [Cyanobacteriota bacterium]MDA0865000.1 SCO5389 family protein [Cyanobacteriota bacterium]